MSWDDCPEWLRRIGGRLWPRDTAESAIPVRVVSDVQPAAGVNPPSGTISFQTFNGILPTPRVQAFQVIPTAAYNRVRMVAHEVADSGVDYWSLICRAVVQSATGVFTNPNDFGIVIDGEWEWQRFNPMVITLPHSQPTSINQAELVMPVSNEPILIVPVFAAGAPNPLQVWVHLMKADV